MDPKWGYREQGYPDDDPDALYFARPLTPDELADERAAGVLLGYVIVAIVAGLMGYACGFLTWGIN